MIKKTISQYPKDKRLFIRIKNRFILPLRHIEKTVPKKGKISELGSGLGMVSIYLGLSSKNRNIIGYDLSKEKVKTANKASKNISNVKFIQKDLSSGEIPRSEAFLLVDFLHHVPYGIQMKILKKITRRQKKGEKIIIKEIEKGFGIRYSLNFFCDKFMTRLGSLYFRKNREWKSIMEKLGYSVQTKRFRTFFPHVILACTKN